MIFMTYILITFLDFPDHVFASFYTRLTNACDIRKWAGIRVIQLYTSTFFFIISNVILISYVYILESAISVMFVSIVCMCCIVPTVLYNVFQNALPLMIAEDHEKNNDSMLLKIWKSKKTRFQSQLRWNITWTKLPL